MPSKEQCERPRDRVEPSRGAVIPADAAPVPTDPGVETVTTDAAAALRGREVYTAVARQALTFWLHTLGPAPWLSIRALNALSPRNSAPVLLRRQSAALGAAILLQLEPDRPHRDHLREAVRAALIGWQRSLRTDGIPAHRAVRRSPLHGLLAGTVITLLGETTQFQNAMLLRDLEQHLAWLATRPVQTPWLEAATIVALAEGALLVRQGELLNRARRRAEDLLSRQDSEGWFPERGGADIGRLSLTVDALARLLRQHEWAELLEPLRRATRFLLHFVHPGGRTGGCYGSGHTSFLSPYGVELLAEELPEAAALAALCRQRCATSGVTELFGHDEDLWTVLGARVALSGVSAAKQLSPAPGFPHEARGVVKFPHAGLTIVSHDAYHAVISERKGGALHVTWRGGEEELEDAGVTVVYPHRVQTSLRHDRRSWATITDESVTCHGILRGILRTPEGSYGWLKRRLRRAARDSAVVEPVPSPAETSAHAKPADRLTHDRFTREVTFEPDAVRIVDRVHCRLPCETIICQAPPHPQPGPFGLGNLADRTLRAPILVEGGRHVEITRVYRQGALVDQRSEPTRRLD